MDKSKLREDNKYFRASVKAPHNPHLERRPTLNRNPSFKIITSSPHATEPTPTLHHYEQKPPFRETDRRIKIPIKKLHRSRLATTGNTCATGGIPEIGIPGIRNILNQQYSLSGKLLWGIAIMTCTGICLYQLVDRFTFYFKRSLTTGIYVNTNHSLYFPLISLCPFIPFRSSEKIIAYKEQLSNRTNKSIKSMEDIWQELPFQDDVNLGMLWNLTAIDADRISLLPSCGYGRRKEECNFSFELKYMFPTLTGVCWVIGKTNDSDPIEYQGPMTGLVIRLEEHPSRHDIEFIKSYSRANRDDRALGYTIFIHDEDTSPKYEASYKGHVIYHSVVTIMAFSIQQFIFLNTSDKPCTDAKSASVCWNKCIEDRILQQAPCRLPFMDYPQLPMCNGTQEYNLSYLTPRAIYLSTSVQDCNCPRRCHTTSYIHNTYVVRDPYFPNTTAINLYFQDNTYQIVKQTEAYPWIALMSDVGGTMGLFLGMCLLSFGEILEIGIKCIQKYACPKSRVCN